MKKLLLSLAFLGLMSTPALAQTYPPSEPPPTTPVVCVDCDTAFTGTDTIGWAAIAALGLVALGTTAVIVARKRSRDA